MDVAVAGVTERERGHAVALADRERLARDVAQSVERYGDVLAEGAAALREDRERRRRRASATARPPRPAASGACTATASSASASCSSAATRRASARCAVGLGDHHERARRPGGRTDRCRRSTRSVTAVQVLDRRRHDPRREHALDRADARLGVAVEADHRQLELGRGDQPQPGGGDEAERPFRADEQALQVVGGDVLAERPADRARSRRAGRPPRCRSPSGPSRRT